MRKRIGVSFLHAIWMVFLTFLWLRQPVIFDFETGITKGINDIVYYFNLGKNKTYDQYKNKFFYINTTHNLILDQNAPYYLPNVRTNRKDLVVLLDSLDRHSDAFESIFLDVFISEVEDSTDQALVNIVKRLQYKQKMIAVSEIVDNIDRSYKQPELLRSIHSYFKERNTFLFPNVFDPEYSGPVYYPLSNSDAFYKITYNFEVEEERVSQAPLKMYEAISERKAKPPFFLNLFYKYENLPGVYQNIYAPPMVIGMQDLSYGNNPLDYQNLENMEVFLEDGFAFLLQKLKEDSEKKIIIIGDFVFGDDHHSSVGRIKGPLIAVNSLIALKSESNKLSIKFIWFLVFSFFLVSYFSFYPEVISGLSKKNYKHYFTNTVFVYIVRKMKYLILFVSTIIGVLWFNYYLFLFSCLIYIYFVSHIVKWWRMRKAGISENISSEEDSLNDIEEN